MQIVRFQHAQQTYYGQRLNSEAVRVWSGAPWSGGEPGAQTLSAADVTFLAPVSPSKIVCVGRNYSAHVRELGNDEPEHPLLFLKPPSSLIGHTDAIRLPPESSRVDHEGELALVIGKPLTRATPDACVAAIAGATCANDVTARDLQKQDVQFTRAKGFDTFCPVGPWVETDIKDQPLNLALRVNGEVRQAGTTADMTWPVPELISLISQAMTLLPGDLVLTGTPEGVGPLNTGDTVEIEIQRIGTLRNRVESNLGSPENHG